MTKYKPRCKFGFQMSSDLGVFRCAVWHYISNNGFPEQSLSLSSGSEYFAGRAAVCNFFAHTDMPPCCQQLFCPVLRKFLLSLSLPAISLPWSQEEPIAEKVPGQTPLVDRWESTCSEVHLNSFFEVVLHQRTWAWGWQKVSWLQPIFIFFRSLLVITHGLSCTFQTLGAEDSHCSGHEADSTHGNHTLQRLRVSTSALLVPVASLLKYLPWGFQCSVSWAGDLHRLSRLEVRGRTGWCCSHEMPA